MKKTFIKLLCCALVAFSLLGTGVSVCAAEEKPPAENGGIYEIPITQV